MTNNELQSILRSNNISNLDIEIWKDINYPNSKYQYQISNYGRFRNKTTGKIIKPYYQVEKNTDGEPIVGYYRAIIHLRDSSKVVKPSIHRLVATCFVENPNPGELVQVDHIDANRHNNHYMNLEWVTQKENLKRASDLKLRKPRYGSDNGSSIWVEDEINLICKLMSLGLTYHKVYEEFIKVYPSTTKNKTQLKNIYYNLISKSNPKWTQITNKYNLR